MPDAITSMPQVAAPQAVAKSPAKAPEARPDSSSGQGFAEVLGQRMEPPEASPSASGAEASAGSEGDASPLAVDPHTGKDLPQGGKAENVLVATLTSGHGAAVGADPLDGSPETTAVATAPLPPTPAALHAAAARQPVVTLRGPEGSNAGAHATGARPEANPVAQAVHQVISESDTGISQPPIRPGDELRAKFGPQLQAVGRETVIERALNQAVQPQTQATPTQALHSAPASEAAAARPVIPTTTLDTPFRQQGWDQSLGERVLWLANQKLQSAEIKLNPARLGPIEIRIQVQQDQAQVSFTAQHAPVREALEAALPRLREMFSASGFDLVDVNVSQHSFAEQQRKAQGFAAGAEAGDVRGAGPEHDAEGGALHRGTGRMTALSGIDLFA